MGRWKKIILVDIIHEISSLALLKVSNSVIAQSGHVLVRHITVYNPLVTKEHEQSLCYYQSN
jgi:hypothetical protein